MEADNRQEVATWQERSAPRDGGVEQKTREWTRTDQGRLIKLRRRVKSGDLF